MQMFVIIKSKVENEECWCECKELNGKGICNKGFIWNPNNCDCACDKSCDVKEYLDYENCKCRNKSVEEFSENIEGNKVIYNGAD